MVCKTDAKASSVSCVCPYFTLSLVAYMPKLFFFASRLLLVLGAGALTSTFQRLTLQAFLLDESRITVFLLVLLYYSYLLFLHRVEFQN